MTKPADARRAAMRARRGTFFLLLGLVTASPRPSSAAECKVLSAAVPDVVRLHDSIAALATLRSRAIDHERTVGELKARPSPATIAQATHAQQRVLGGAAPNSAGVIGAMPGPASLTKTVTYSDGGKTYTVTVPATISDSFAIESAKRAREREEAIGPERNPLILAVDGGDPRAVKRLIAQGIDLHAVLDRYGVPTAVVARAVSRWYGQAYDQTEFLRQQREAVAFIAITRMLVEAGADVSGTYLGGTALARIASGNGRNSQPAAAPELAKYLLQHGATLTAPGIASKVSLLDPVAQRGDEALFDVMLRHGKPTQDQLTSAFAAAFRSGELRIAERAIAAGADPIAGVGSQLFQSTAGTRPLLIAMLRRTFNPNVVLGDGSSPLMRVIHDHELMRAFLERGADPNFVRASDGNTALHLATAFERNPYPGLPPENYSARIRARSVELLLRHGAKPGIPNKAGITPLMQTTRDDKAAIELLLAAGATVDPDSGDGGSLKKRGFPLGPVSWALAEGNETLATALVRHGYGLDANDCGAVFYAAAGGAADTLTALVGRHAAAGDFVEASGETPLIAAASAGHSSTVQVLLQRRAANVNEASRVPPAANYWERPVGGVTALMVAARWARFDVVNLLLDSGANVEQRDRLGQTAWDYASAANDRPNDELARRLTSRGALPHDVSGDATLPMTADDRAFGETVSEAIRRSMSQQLGDIQPVLASPTYPVLPGDDSNYERLECERRSTFTLTRAGGELGSLSVSQCLQHGHRARQLAEHAADGVRALQALGFARADEAAAMEAGLYFVHRELDSGSDFFYFPVVVIGHGVFVTYTSVLSAPNTEIALIIQLASSPECEHGDARNALWCRTPEKALQGLASEVMRGQ